jgi:hypothetical protein
LGRSTPLSSSSSNPLEIVIVVMLIHSGSMGQITHTQKIGHSQRPTRRGLKFNPNSHNSPVMCDLPQLWGLSRCCSLKYAYITALAWRTRHARKSRDET